MLLRLWVRAPEILIARFKAINDGWGGVRGLLRSEKAPSTMARKRQATTREPGRKEKPRMTVAAVFPVPWRRCEGLSAGFGDRFTQPEEGMRVTTVRQVHGATVVRTAPSASELAAVEGDVLVAERPGVVVAVVTADCVPILLIAPQQRWAAAVHAGWRGTVAGAATAAAAAAAEAGVPSEQLFAALGPSIGPCCYDVGEDVAERFRTLAPTSLRVFEDARRAVDLRDANRSLLIASGLRPERIDLIGPCTRCRADRYHSYRAAREKSGRQLSWVGWQDRSS